MRQILRRTHATSLSDDELTLLDVIFHYPEIPWSSLLKKYIIWQWNTRHDMEDKEVDAVLSRFVEGGMLTKTRRPMDGQTWQGRLCLTMTPEGGRVWESERMPDWSHFLDESYEQGRSRVFIVSPSASICEDFWRIGWETDYFNDYVPQGDITPGDTHMSTVHDDGRLIPWKRFDELHEFVGSFGGLPVRELTSEELIRRNEEEKESEIEARRTWWQNIDELAKFQMIPG